MRPKILVPLIISCALLMGIFSASAHTPVPQFDIPMSKALSDQLARLRKDLDPEQVPIFDQAQAHWMLHRASSCAFEASLSQGGSIYGSLIAQCTALKDQARLKELKAWSACEEGDLLCPGPNKR